MQNNVTDLSQKIQRALDSNYNVIDMPAVIEIISVLEKTSVTKELLETTRLGKYINELRRRTSNEALAKRAKDLLKKWRDLILPEANGQLRSAGVQPERSDSPDVTLLGARKRAALENRTPVSKRPAINGQSREFDLSDNSNCSFKDAKKNDVIFINSDSNSSMPDQTLDSVTSTRSANDSVTDDSFSSSQPKKRGRKKGSKNHTNLVLAAEESFSNKMAVSRNSKVKTTQELLADLQNRAVTKQNQDIELRAAQLTESLSRIDQKLNPQKVSKGLAGAATKFDRIAHVPNKVPSKTLKGESGSTTVKQEKLSGVASQWLMGRGTPEVVELQSDDEIVDVCSVDSGPVVGTTDLPSTPVAPVCQTVEDIIRQLPSIDYNAATSAAEDDVPECVCPVPQVEEPDKITVEIVGEPPAVDVNVNSPLVSPSLRHVSDCEPKPEPQPPDACVVSENLECPARLYLRDKYELDADTDAKVTRLQHECLPNINGNWGVGPPDSSVKTTTPDSPTLYDNIVPNAATERLRRDVPPPNVAAENYNKYSVSIDTPNPTFREWHETLNVLSYNGETLTILPYVIID